MPLRPPPSKIRQHDELSAAGDQSAPGTSRAVDPQQTQPQALDEERVARIKSEWRHCQNLNDFAELTGLDTKDLNSALGFSWRRASLRSNTFTAWITYQAETYLSVVRTALESHNDASGIRWPKPQLSDETVDDGIAIYVELMKIDYDYNPDNIDAYTRTLRQLLPVEQDSSREQADLQVVEMQKAWAEAFHQRPVPGRDVVGPIFETIREYYGKFNSQKYFAPYTSLVGPSGVGKSYVVQLLAKELNVFVIYISLARKYHEGYPARSAIANKIDEFDKRHHMTTFFECFLAANMSFVKLCKEHGITPSAFYDLQVMEEHYEFQTRLATHVVTLFERVSSDGIPHYNGRPREKSEYTKSQKDVDKGEFDHQEYVNRHIVWFEQHVRDDFASISLELEKKTEYGQQMELDPSDDVPSAVVCMDEARELFYRSSDPQMRFLAFRRAMRHRSRYSANQDTKSFFTLMLDTSAQVSDFSPPWSHDHSAKSLSMHPPLDPEMMIEQHHPDMLFPPIYKINSMDVFSVESTPASNNDGSDRKEIASQLFRLGRPL